MPHLGRYSEQATLLAVVAIVATVVQVGTHVVFARFIGYPDGSVFAVLVFVLIVRVSELYWIKRSRASFTDEIVRRHSLASAIFAFVTAWFMSTASHTEDSHYSVLFLLGVLPIAFFHSFRATIVAAFSAAVLGVLQVWFVETEHNTIEISEYFEAASVGLIYFVAGLVTWVVVHSLRIDRALLQASVRELEASRARIIQEEKLGAIGRLASALAHEIRNPVASISGALAAARQSDDAHTNTEMLDIAERESKRLALLTGDFLAYAKPPNPQVLPVAVRPLLEYVEAVASAQFHALPGNRCFRIVCPPDLNWPLDSNQMTQALINLAVNACQVEGDTIHIELFAQVDHHGLLLGVKNDGPVIAHDVVQRIFEPFFTTRNEGTGLGLSIVHGIAKAHGGELRLSRNEPGHVAFTMTIPGDGTPNSRTELS